MDDLPTPASPMMIVLAIKSKSDVGLIFAMLILGMLICVVDMFASCIFISNKD